VLSPAALVDRCRKQLADHVIDEAEDRRATAEVLGERQYAARTVAEAAFELVPERDVGATEAVDALLRVADEDQARRRGIARDGEPAEQVGHLALDRIDILELVDDEEADATLGGVPHAGLAQQVARRDQQL